MLRLSLVLALAVSACDSGTADSQRLFEDRALLSPVEGITRIDADGTVGERDPSDWQIGPLYQARYEFAFLPSPNPVSKSQESLSFSLAALGSTAGTLQVSVLQENRAGALELVPIPGGNCQVTASAPVCSLDLFPSQFGLANADGLYRLVILDGRGIVSYGDVQVNL